MTCWGHHGDAQEELGLEEDSIAHITPIAAIGMAGVHPLLQWAWQEQAAAREELAEARDMAKAKRDAARAADHAMSQQAKVHSCPGDSVELWICCLMGGWVHVGESGRTSHILTFVSCNEPSPPNRFGAVYICGLLRRLGQPTVLHKL